MQSDLFEADHLVYADAVRQTGHPRFVGSRAVRRQCRHRLPFPSRRDLGTRIGATAVDGGWIIDGSKTFITSGILADEGMGPSSRVRQLHGGYGYRMEYPVARAFIDARVQRIYGGTNDIMKHIIGRDALSVDRRD